MDKTIVHVIPHSHWDREWYFTTSRSTVYLMNHMKNVLETLEKNPDFSYYMLDAQSSLMEDYLDYYPEDTDRVKALVKSQRILIGPWYTQTDQLVISSESIVRNLLYGTRYAESLGHSMRIGYVPDAFGQGGNMPQIYKNFDIHTFLFWRGVADNRLKQTEFTWEGDDGTRMLAEQIPFGYYYGGVVPSSGEAFIDFLDRNVSKLEAKASTRHVYYPNGFDQAPLFVNLPEAIEKANEVDEKREYVIHSPEKFFEDLEKDVKDLPVIHGELTEGKHSRLHKSIFSVRADLKIQNNQLEDFLANTLEPVLVISNTLGNPYPHREVEKIWKILFQNAAHDSIGGCNSDDTNQDVDSRGKIAWDLAKNLLDLHMRLISEKIPFENEVSFTAFNPLPYSSGRVVSFSAYLPGDNFTLVDANGASLEYTILSEVDLTEYVLNQTINLTAGKDVWKPEQVKLTQIEVYLPELPALGYTTFSLLPDQTATKSVPVEKATKFIENEKYKIEVADDNTLTFTEKATGYQYKNQMEFVENGNDGDSYNYSPPRNDLEVSSRTAVRTGLTMYSTPVGERLELSFKMMVPKDLKERADGTCSVEMPVTATVVLRKDSPLIEFDASVENQALSHRLSVLFDSQIANHISHADALFGMETRPVYLKEMEIWEEEQWEEAPISVEPMQGLVSATNNQQGIAILTNGVREYEFVGENYSQIRLTLFCTFSHMGKVDLLWRPGRASGESIVETPDAQLLGAFETSFAFTSFQGSFDENEIGKISKEYHTTFPVYESADFLNGRMIFAFMEKDLSGKPTYSVADFSDTDTIFSAIKKAEGDQGYILRVFNPFEEKSCEFSTSLSALGTFVEADEETAAEKITALKPNEFCTIHINNF